MAPNGSSAVLMSDIGSGADVENLTLVIDDQAQHGMAGDQAIPAFGQDLDVGPGVHVRSPVVLEVEVGGHATQRQ